MCVCEQKKKFDKKRPYYKVHRIYEKKKKALILGDVIGILISVLII